jgi:hypothetical protein
MDQEHGDGDMSCSRDRADPIHFKAALFLGDSECAIDDASGEEEWCALGRHRSQVGERLCRDDRRDPRIGGRFLQRHGGPE